MKAALTRRYHFSSSHRLHAPALSNDENARIFGKCNNPYGHGHNYELEVTARGTVDPETGLLLDVRQLDRFVSEKVLSRFANRNINMDLPEFRQLVPTTENIAIVIGKTLDDGWGDEFGAAGAKLMGIHVQETDRNGFDLAIGAQDHHHEDSVLNTSFASVTDLDK
jgi:6-pyruvoyltetrahydropterin/6-carboxytetrahydropterin synthase